MVYINTLMMQAGALLGRTGAWAVDGRRNLRARPRR